MGGMTPTYAQPNFRIRSDDSQTLNADAGWEGALNANATIDAHKRFRIRFEVEETASNGGNNSFKLQVKKNAGSFVDAVFYDLIDVGTANTSTGNVWIGQSNQYADNDATTNVLSGSSRTFVAGDGCEDPVTGTINISNEHTEIEFTIVIPTYYDDGTPGRNVDGDTFEFRIVEGDGTVFTGTYNNPVITLNIPNNYIGGTFIESPLNAGPFVDSNNNMYYFMEYDELSADTVMLKSTDGGVTWAPQDESNNPTNNDLESVDIFQDGDTLHILHQYGDVVYHTFRMSDHPTNADTWGITDESVATGTTQLEQGCSIIVRSDGTIVGFYNNSDGTNERARYKIRSTGGTWGSENNLDSTASTSFLGSSAVLGASDKTHVFYKDHTNGDLYHKDLNSSDVLSSRQLVDGDAGTSTDYRLNFTNAVYYDDGGVEVICIAYIDASDTNLYARYLRDGTLQTRAAISDATVLANPVAMNSRMPVASLAVNGKTVYGIYTDLSSVDLYYASNDDEGGWGTPVEEADGVNADQIIANVITRSGTNYLAYVIEDTLTIGTITNGGASTPYSGYTGGSLYGEITLSAGPTTVSLAGSLSSSGTIKKKTKFSLAGSLSSAGTTIKKGFATLAGSLGSSGIVSTSKRATALLAGTLNSSGVVSTAATFRATLTGTLNSSGDLIKKALKKLAGTLNSSGTASGLKLGQLFFQTISGTLNSSGALSLSKRLSALVEGTLNSAGTIKKKTTSLLQGTLSSSGTIAKKAFALLDGSLGSSGTIKKKAFALLEGTLNSSGVQSGIKLGNLFFQTVSGTLNSSGVLSTSALFHQLLEGTLSSAGTISKKVANLLEGTLNSAGVLSRKISKILQGTLNSSGVQSGIKLGNLFFQTVTGTLNSSGALTLSKRFSQLLAGSLSSAGNLSRKTSKSIYGILTSSATISKQIGKNLQGVLNSAGTISKKSFLSLAGTLNLSGIISTVLNPLYNVLKRTLRFGLRREFGFTLLGRSWSMNFKDDESRSFNSLELPDQDENL